LPPPRNTGVPNCKLCESLAHFQGSGAPCRVGTDGRGASSCQNPPRENEQTSDVSVSRLPNTSPYSGFLKSHARPLRDKIPHTTFGHHPTVYFGPNSHRPHQANTPHATSNKHPKDHIRPTSHRPFRANLPHTTSSQLPTGHFDSTSHYTHQANLPQAISGQPPKHHVKPISHMSFRSKIPPPAPSQTHTCSFEPKSNPHQSKIPHSISGQTLTCHIMPSSHTPFMAVDLRHQHYQRHHRCHHSQLDCHCRHQNLVCNRLALRPDGESWGEEVNVMCMAHDCLAAMQVALDDDGAHTFDNETLNKIESVILDGLSVRR
jgi:hypothetical protein